MQAPPLTHHDIVRRAAPLTRSGLKVNLGACDRTRRYIEFDAQPAHHGSVMQMFTLEVNEENKQRLCRVLVHDSGLVSTLSAVTSDLDNAFAAFSQIPLTRQVRLQDNTVAAYSYSLTPDSRKGQELAIVRLRFVCAHVAFLEMRVDVSTGGGMPADVRLLVRGTSSSYLRETLADGGVLPLDHPAARTLRQEAFATPLERCKPDLPEDLLAILGAQWRPLRHQGDHWKGVLRQLNKLEKRTQLAETYIEQALDHLHTTLSSTPEQYQPKHRKARWQVYTRRLQPLMVFVGILALMPISWLFVSSGTMTIHPLALGLTPLLMVGVVVLTAREIPVMELPSRPAPLQPTAWTAFNMGNQTPEHNPDKTNDQSQARLQDHI